MRYRTLSVTLTCSATILAPVVWLRGTMTLLTSVRARVRVRLRLSLGLRARPRLRTNIEDCGLEVTGQDYMGHWTGLHGALDGT